MNAQATPAEGEPSQQADPLADRQAVIADRVKRLEDRMFQLAQALRKSDPDKASRLVDGLGAMREEQLETQIDAIVALLKKQQYADATDAQSQVESQMQALLKLLLEETHDLDKQREEIERLEKIRKQLDQILDKQKQAKARTEAADAQRRVAEALDDAAQTARELLDRQEGLSADQGQGGANGARPAERQAALRGETEALSRDVAELADRLRAADAAAEANAEQPSSGGESSGSEEGEDAPAGGKVEESPPGSASKGGQAADKAQAAGSRLNEAAESMQKAESSLRTGDDAKSDQAKAEEALEKAIDELQGEVERIRNKLKLEEEAEKQRTLAEESTDLLDEMRGTSDDESDGEKGKSGEKSSESESESESGGEQPSGDSQSGGSDSSGGESSGNPQSPGEQPLEQAIPHQQEAAKNLDKQLPDEAAKEQQMAIDELERAKEDLEERLDQIRREQQEQLLSALESRFRGMLARQLEVNKATNRLIDLGMDQWKRSDQLELAELSEKQRWVGDEADEAMFLLIEEGSTVVLPPLLEQVRDDARTVADRLAAAQADRDVRMMQEDLELVLRDMIDAIKKQQEEMEQGGGGGGGGGSPPLLPGSAELKLLRSCQLRINKSTESVYEEIERDGSADDLRSAIQRLSTKQEDVAEMARSMHESLRQAQ